jgi:hypothetical protein
MALTTFQVKRIIAIIRQHEVLYGGGISSGDAAYREDCEKLVDSLEEDLPPGERSRKVRSALLPTGRGLRTKPSKGSKLERRAEKELKAGKSDKGAKVAKADKKAEKAKAAPDKPKGKAEARKEVTVGRFAETRHEAEIAESRKDQGGRQGQAAQVQATKAVAPKEAPEPRENPAVYKPRGNIHAMHLFDAYAKNMLPKYGGFILSARFFPEEQYSVLEFTGYENVQDIYTDGESLVFKTAGCKLYCLIEKATYSFKNVEPVNRQNEYSIPYRFVELNKIVTKRFQNIYIGKKPVVHSISFSIYKPKGDNIAILFYDQANVYENIQDFLIALLHETNAIPVIDARKASEHIIVGLKQFHTWLDVGD